MNANQTGDTSQQQSEWKGAVHAATSFLTSPWGVALLAVLGFFSFAPFSDTIMSNPSPKTVIISAASGITVLVWVFALVMLRGASAPVDPVVAPFRVSSSQATLLIGSGPNAMSIRLAKDRTTPLSLINSPSESPLTATLKDGILVLDLNLMAADGKSAIRFKDNELVDPPARWDWNSNETAFEVIDDSGTPVMQVIRKNDSTVMLLGTFLFPQGGIVADSNGGQLALGRLPSRRASLSPLFKYPSWKHRGSYAE